MTKKPESRIVLALDQMSKERALKIAEETSGLVWGFKVHELLFHYGAEIVYDLKQWGKVIADARLWGAEGEIRRNIRIFKTAGADIVTVMGSAGYSVKSDLEYLASADCLDSWGHSCSVLGYGYCAQGTKINVLRDDKLSLYIFGRDLVARENLLEEIKKTNNELDS